MSASYRSTVMPLAAGIGCKFKVNSEEFHFRQLFLFLLVQKHCFVGKIFDYLNNIAIKLLTSLLFSHVSPSWNHFFYFDFPIDFQTLTLAAGRLALQYFCSGAHSCQITRSKTTGYCCWNILIVKVLKATQHHVAPAIESKWQGACIGGLRLI